MFTSYQLALLGCFVTMICWGSWSNVQKATQGLWPFQFLYCDYTIGFLLVSLLMLFFSKKESDYSISLPLVDSKHIFVALLSGKIIRFDKYERF